MAIIPCPNKVQCPTPITGDYPASPFDVDTPFVNYSSEDPDNPIFLKREFDFNNNTGYKTFGAQGCDGICWSDVSQEEADACAASSVGFCFVGGTQCQGGGCRELPEGYWNTPQTCTKPCPTAEGGSVSYTTAAERFYADTQEEANTLAFNHACSMVVLLCADPGFEPYVNEAQSCTYVCDDGTEHTWTTPPGFFEAADQLTANTIAYTYACLMAKLNCTEPVPYYNTAQQCTAKCADGTSFTFAVNAGVYVAWTQAEADFFALTYACQQATKHRMCLAPPFSAKGCIGSVPAIVLTVGGGVSPITWSVVGSLPEGFSTIVNPTNERQIAVVGGGIVAGDYTFSLKATDAGDFTIEKEIALHVIDFADSEFLPDATADTAYSHTLTAIGTPSPPVSWTVVAGELPPGLVLDEQTGEISGTPTTAGVYDFTVALQDEAT